MLEAVRQFADPQVAHDFFLQIRFPNGVGCPRTGCGSGRVAYLEKHRRWYCNACKKQFSAKVGTMFEDSPIGLDKWLPAVWLIASNRNGISSYELARALKVTQKTAWFMLHRIREAMDEGVYDDDRDGRSGRGVHRRKYKSKSLSKRKPLRERRIARGVSRPDPYDYKTAVLGMVERGGRVRAWNLLGQVPKRPCCGSYAIAFTTTRRPTPTLRRSTPTLTSDFLMDSTVNHSIEEYVRGHVHTKSIECFWGVLKRTIGGTTHVRPADLDRYLAEQVFRFDARKEKDGPRFARAVKRADGRRLTWKALTDKATR